ncbi:hypothetical protein BT67DRAFT_442555 [Trichocladium antarcticum]|uniref:Uncharacterized protein n=1 Tax=Trichocladium antarcticum TaxID=1450529 RepID=A0AAN6ZCW5_9PEZI|nr:hypothetical protein BT67DRAFT_442555 [Trichocladium antarcticum]
MVTTRRRAHTAAAEDADSRMRENDIPAQSVRHKTVTGTPISLRPRKAISGTGDSALKRKRTGSVNGARRAKRAKQPKQQTKAQHSIEVEGQTEDETHVNGALLDLLDQPQGNIIVAIPSVRRPRTNTVAASTTTVLSETRSVGSGPRLRARGIKRGVRSLEIFGEVGSIPLRRSARGNASPGTIRETPQPEHDGPAAEDDDDGAPSGHDPGSPELQSSALRRRAKRPAHGVYNVPVSEPSTPRGPRPRATRSAPGQPSRASTAATRPRPKPPSVRNDARLSSIREEELRWSASSPPPHPAARQAPAPRAGRGAAAPVSGHEAGSSEVAESEFEEEGEEVEAEEDEAEEDETEEDDEEESEESDAEAVEQIDVPIRSRVHANRAAVDVHMQPYDGPQRTMTLVSDHIDQMLLVMGGAGWTGTAERWDIRRGASCLTKLGKRCFRRLSRVKDKLDKIRGSFGLPGQSRSITEEEQRLNRAMEKVEKMVTKILDNTQAILGEHGRSTNSRLRNAVVKDVLSYLMPMLVLVLRSCFGIGVPEHDGADCGRIFTSTTIQYLLRVTSWLLRLGHALVWQLSQQSRDNDEYDASGTEDREKFGVMLRKWKEQLQLAVDGFNEQVGRDEDLLRKKQRDTAVKAAKEKAEQEQHALAAERDEAVHSSIRQIVQGPRPRAEMWRKATQHWGPAPPPRSVPSSGVWTVAPSPSRRTPAPSPAVLDDDPWPADDTNWLLIELERRDRRPGYLEFCAETLDRPVAQVREERERLKRLGRYRSPPPRG